MKAAKKSIPVFGTSGDYVIGEIGCGEKTLVLGETTEGTVVAYILGIVKPSRSCELVEEEFWEEEVCEKDRLLCYAGSIMGSKRSKVFSSYLVKREKAGKNLFGECTKIGQQDIKAGDLVFDSGQKCIGVYMGDGSAVVENKNADIVRKDVGAIKEVMFGRPKHSGWDEDDVCYNRSMRRLRRCMRGDDVRAVQIALLEKGYNPGRIDGQYTSRTKKAVTLFQKANMLVPNGAVDYTTWKCLIGGD